MHASDETVGQHGTGVHPPVPHSNILLFVKYGLFYYVIQQSELLPELTYRVSGDVENHLPAFLKRWSGSKCRLVGGKGICQTAIKLVTTN